MAKRTLRQRRTSYGSSPRRSPRQTSWDLAVPIGIGYKTGRRATAARRSLPRSVLPSLNPWVISPRLIPSGLERRPVRPIVQVVGRANVQRFARDPTISRIQRDFRIPRNPAIPAKKYNHCQIRSRRKSVMFALDVAGRKWGRGGPKMRGARRNSFSNYSCL